jgi:hypothetical protein
MMGYVTAVSRNVHVNRRPPKESERVVSPQQGMIFPAGPNRERPEGADKE